MPGRALQIQSQAGNPGDLPGNLEWPYFAQLGARRIQVGGGGQVWG
jgi:hypothetical protein